MSVGYSVGKGDLDLALGTVAINTRDLIGRAVQVVECLATFTDTQLENMGYSAEDLVLVRAVQADITLLAGIITGQAALPANNDFTSNLKKLYGAH